MTHSPPQTILITGASSGIGAALANHYAAPGVTLHLGARRREKLEDTAAACKAKGADVHVTSVDVTDKAAMHDWITQADDLKPLDLVIANAGISGGTDGAAEGEPAAQARKVFDVNVTGVLNTIEPVQNLMTGRKHGQIALMSSLAAFSGWPGAPAYSASKGAVRLYGEALRGALSPFGVKVSVICPGFIKTPMTAVNDYSMPFMMEAGDAAALIARKLAADKGRIAFPWPTYAFAGLIGLLPYGLSSRLLSAMPAKPAQG